MTQATGKTLTIVNAVYGDASGGRWQAVLNTNKALAQHRHRSYLLTGIENQHLQGATQAKIINNSGFYDALAALRVRRWLRSVRPDMIIAHSGRAVWLLKNATVGTTVPVIAINHSHNVKRTIRADGFIHITPHVRTCVHKALKKSGQPIKPEVVIPNAVIIPSQPPAPIMQQPPFTIGVMTRLVRYKGTHLLLDALAKVRQQGYECRLRIAGDGEEGDSLMQQAQQLNLTDSIDWLGWIGTEQKPEFYRHCDAIAVPTLNDTQPLAILDAFAHGKAVIASDHIACQQIVTHNINALLAAQNNSSALADAIITLIQQPQLAQKLANNGYMEAIQHYNDAVVAEKLNQFVLDMAHLEIESTR